jgi:hypothetical protein
LAVWLTAAVAAVVLGAGGAIWAAALRPAGDPEDGNAPTAKATATGQTSQEPTPALSRAPVDESEFAQDALRAPDFLTKPRLELRVDLVSLFPDVANQPGQNVGFTGPLDRRAVPVFSAGMLFALTGTDVAVGAEIMRVDRDGEDLWGSAARFDGHAYPAVISAGRIYLEDGSNVLTIDPASGATLWRAPLGEGAAGISDMCLAGNGALAVHRDQSWDDGPQGDQREWEEPLMLIDGVDGSVLAHGLEGSLLACGHDAVYALTRDDRLAAYPAGAAAEPTEQSGPAAAQLWALDLPNSEVRPQGPIVTEDGRMFFVTEDFDFDEEDFDLDGGDVGMVLKTLAIHEVVAP